MFLTPPSQKKLLYVLPYALSAPLSFFHLVWARACFPSPPPGGLSLRLHFLAQTGWALSLASRCWFTVVPQAYFISSLAFWSMVCFECYAAAAGG